MVLTAAHSDTTQAQDALAHLCQTYWPPLYAYLRRRGYSPEDAQDLTQGFFAQLLKRNAVAAVNPEKGRFRSFLLASFNHFLSDEWDKARAQKRGAGQIDFVRYQNCRDLAGKHSFQHGLTPETRLRNALGHHVVGTSLSPVGGGTSRAEQGPRNFFETLRTTLAGPGNSAPYSELGQRRSE